MHAGFDEQIDRIRSGTHAVIDLDAYTANIHALRSIVGDDVALMAVVKADAYGHGAVECGRAAIEAGAWMLGVARIHEALYLRQAGLDCQIVLIGPPSVGEVRDALERDITLAVGSQLAVDGVVASARSGLSARVHVKVDTGMNRYGFAPDDLCAAVETLATQRQRMIRSSGSGMLSKG
jgi:alanine racemase